MPLYQKTALKGGFFIWSKKWWKGQDLNLCTLTRADLQSAAINHSATLPRVKYY
jgi:hypothetical protein